jgi:FtsZ-binding cell division protein ZapB
MKLLFAISLLLFPLSVFAAATTTGSLPAPVVQYGVAYADLESFKHEMFSEVINTNLGYLNAAIAIVVLAAAAAIFIFQFSFINPQKEDIEKQRADIEKQREELKRQGETIKLQEAATQEKIDALTKTFESKHSSLEVIFTSKLNEFYKETKSKIDSANAENASLKEEVLTAQRDLKSALGRLEILTSWHEHYIWMAHDVPANVVRSLLWTLKLEKQHQKEMVTEIALDSLVEFVPKLKPGELKEFIPGIKDAIAANKEKFPEKVGQIAKMIEPQTP